VSGVVIGMDPHKRSATIEITNDREQILGQDRFTTDTGYRQMLGIARR
jgi:transposase